jgi:Zn-dependent M28 family amino/carboxypeptidase
VYPAAGGGDLRLRIGSGIAATAIAAVAWVSQSALPAVTSRVIDAPRLLEDLRVLSSDAMEGRQIGTPGGEKARAYVIARFQASGIAPFGTSYEAPFAFTSGRLASQSERRGVNVVGRIEGARWPKRYLVVSAHYDHIGARGGQVFNGADDDASGTAALFALGRYFSTHEPAHSILFVAFDGEEAGLRGSRAFVAAPPVDAAALALDVNVDMIGRDPNDKLFVVGTHQLAFLRPYVDQIAAKAPVTLLAGHDDPGERGVEDWTRDSDHYAFMQAGIPALYFGVEDFDQHHRATDDFETITYGFYVRAVETLVRAVEIFDANLEAIAAERGR